MVVYNIMNITSVVYTNTAILLLVFVVVLVLVVTVAVAFVASRVLAVPKSSNTHNNYNKNIKTTISLM